MTIKIMTDTGAFLTQRYINQHDIAVVSGRIRFGEDIYRENPDLPPARFYEKLNESPLRPILRSPYQRDYRQAFGDLARAHPDAQVISFHTASQLNESVESARQAAASFGGVDIRLIDTRTVSIGMVLMIDEAVRMAEANADMEQIIERMLHMRERIKSYALINTLKYLVREGLVRRSDHLLAQLTNNKALVSFHSGEFELVSQLANFDQGYEFLRNLFLEAFHNVAQTRVICGHANAPNLVQRLADDIRQSTPVDRVLTAEMGATVSTATGPGALSLAWYVPDEG